MNPIRILVVEDDPFIAQEITDYLYDIDYQVAGICRSYEQAVKVLKSTPLDLALLDIELATEKTGIDIAKYIRSQQLNLPIVFLTSMTDKRMIDSVKETRPDGFIVKPFDERDLQSNIEIALFRYASQTSPHDQAVEQESDFLLNGHYFIRSKNQLLKIKPSDIVWAEADDNYTHLHLQKGHHLITSTLKQVEDKLPSPNFIRIHRSYLINLHYLDRIEDQFACLGDKSLPISRSYKSKLMERLSLL